MLSPPAVRRPWSGPTALPPEVACALQGLAAGARVAVAMSGGVDSSVVAALVAAAGFEAVGLTLQLYDQGAASTRGRRCCGGRDIADARAVADHLGIAHYVIDLEDRFREAVIDDFAATYAAGRTPVPCIRCNERVKFGDLLTMARDLGAEALATGHYVRRVVGGDGSLGLWRAADPSRDQSYFLFTTTSAQLAFLRFPLGGLPKASTRELAAAFGLPVAAKPDSQDICFVPSGDHAAMVAKLRPETARPGAVLHVDGRPLGEHRGIGGFTVGQRRGLGVALQERLYVVGIDAASRAVTVGPRASVRCAEALLQDISWVGSPPRGAVGACVVKHRHNEAAVPAHLELLPDARARVVFQTPQAGVAPGQACVAYVGEQLLGGGWIAQAPRLA